jgi:glutamine cyclotransferase
LSLNTVGDGVVTLSPDDGTYDDGTVVDLLAVPDSSWEFVGWSGDISSYVNPESITIDANKTVTATFTEIPIHYTYAIVNIYPHDEAAFTQGLVYDDGFLYEGTGLYGQSTLRRVELETGNVLQIHSLPSHLFGEGITIFEDKIIQITWTSKKGFVYDQNSFDLLQEFTYPTEGWGITHDGSQLIMSIGNATLYFLDPVSFNIIGQIEVYDEEPITRLNELEYIDGMVYANIWMEKKIAIINPETGQVTGWIYLEGLFKETGNQNDVLNGIAYDEETDRLFVTGKRWSNLYEIILDPVA